MLAVFAPWQMISPGCAALTALHSASNRSICRSVPVGSGSSAVAMCVKQPVSATPGRLSISRVSACASSAVRTPMRFMPVSSLRCTLAHRPNFCPACASARMRRSSKTTCVKSFCTTASAALSSMPPSTRIGAAMPASRSSMPSSGMATASISAPASSAAFATGTAPCPYASALTTAKNRAPPAMWLFITPTLWRIAARSISQK